MAQRWSKKGIWDADGPWDGLPKNWDLEGKCIWLPLEKDLIARLGGSRIGSVGSHVRASSITYADPDSGNQIRTHTDNIPVFEKVGGSRALRIEPDEKNNLLYARDLTQVSWVKANCTPLKDQVGEDNIANSASSLLATAGNATCLQTLVLGAADYAYSISIKRITGVGNIEVTDDNGVNWTDIKANLSTSTWYRHTITRNQANPVCGVRIATDTDKIAIDYNQLEAAKIGSSRILTTNAAVTRSTESGYPLWTLPVGLFNAEGTCSVWVRFGFAHDVDSGTHGIITTRDVAASGLIYVYDAEPRIYTYDETSSARVTLIWSANTWYKLVVRWSPITSKMKVGYDSGAGIVWGTEAAFDGSYTLGASLRFGYGLFGPMWLRDLRIWDRVLSDSQINAGGSPS